jgi:peptidoglycan/xylan/chitin deacetylase (PgdA/CDA1 family)
MKPPTRHHFSSHLNPLGHLSRRGFISATAAVSAATLASCKAVPGISELSNNPGNLVPRNPANNYPYNYTPNSGVTFSRVMVSGNYIAITYDDGPHPVNTPRLLDMLAARNIKATFYVIGNSVNQNPGVLRRTVAEGHEIGNHTQTHPLLSKLSDSQLRQEMQRCQDSIGRAAGIRPRTMRPPYGGLLQRQRELVLKEFGYPTIMWSVDPLDWKRPGASVITSRIVSGTTAGGIVLAHDLHSQTIDAMPQTLDGLLRRGFKFVTVSQLISMQTAPPTAPPTGQIASTTSY